MELIFVTLLNVMSRRFLCSPDLTYSIRPLKLGCSNISQWPSSTLQDWQSDMQYRSWMDSQSSINSWVWPPKLSLSQILILNCPLCCRTNRYIFIHANCVKSVFTNQFESVCFFILSNKIPKGETIKYEIAPLGSCDKNGCCPSSQCPSCQSWFQCAEGQGSLPFSRRPGYPGSLSGRTPQSNRCPPCRNCSDSGACGCRCSQCCTHRTDPGSSSPHRK